MNKIVSYANNEVYIEPILFLMAGFSYFTDIFDNTLLNVMIET